MKKLFLIVSFLIVFTAPVWAFNINPGNVDGQKGTVINVPIEIKNIYSAIEANAIGFTIKYDADILSFDKTNIEGSLLETFTLVEGKENTPGIVKIGGSHFTDKVFLTDGLLLSIQLKVKADAKGNSKIELSNFKDALKGAESNSSVFILK